MSECPPKKKLKQATLKDLFSPSTSKVARRGTESDPEILDDKPEESETIESSIECLRINSFSSDMSAADEFDPTEVKKGMEGMDNKLSYGKGNRSPNLTEKSEENIKDSLSPRKKESNGGSPKKKKKNSGSEFREATSSRGYDNRTSSSRSPRGKSSAKGSPPKRSARNETSRKSPVRSPGKEKDGQSSEQRRLRAEAAERRRRYGDSLSPETSGSEPPLSPDMFEDEHENNAASEKESGITWRGSPMSSMASLTKTNANVPPVRSSPNHTVLVKLPLSSEGAAAPYPSSYSDMWSSQYVRMPCSPKSMYPLGKESSSIVQRWTVICKALQRDIKSATDLQNAILEYNNRYASKWKFRGLQVLFEEELDVEESDHFFSNTLPAMVHLALSLPKLVTQPVPLLVRGTTHSITISQMQIASLLANAFFCTFPRRNAKGNETEYSSYPDINFNRLFFHKEKRSLEKLKCIINYFRRVTTKEPVGNVTFTRQHIPFNEKLTWETQPHPLPGFHIDTNGLIEETAGMLQVDFANKFLGGGVLGLGCVQEEIRFVLCPELLISRLFTQALDKTEALIITGVEQFNRGTGYANSFCWDGSYEDKTQCDPWKRRMCQVTAIDALHFTRRPKVQYKRDFVERELNKAYAGFRVLDESRGTPVAVATGNWGCGAFRGDPRLKSLIQLAVCGAVGRDVAYFTFGDAKLRNDLSTMYIFLKENNVTVGELVQVLYHHGMREFADGSDLFQYIYHNLGAYDTDTDVESEGTGARKCTSDNNVNENQERSKAAIKMTQNFKDYFIKGSRTCSSSSAPPCSSKAPQHQDTASNKSSSYTTTSDITKEGSLTDKQISEALDECERLIRKDKGKCRDKSDSDNSNRTKEKDGDDNRKSHGSGDNDTKDAEKTSECKPSKLLASLDEIDNNAQL